MLRLTENQYRDRVHFGGPDHIPIVVMGGHIYPSLFIQTVTLSYYLDLVPVRALGSRAPLTHRFNSLTVAGTIISYVTDKMPFYDIIKDLKYSNYFFAHTQNVKTYQIPPFDLMIFSISEAGRMSISAIYGITLNQGGYTFSIQDTFTEAVFQYQAADFTEGAPRLVTPSQTSAQFEYTDLFSRYDVLGMYTDSGVAFSEVLGSLALIRRKMLAIIEYLQSPNVPEDLKKIYIDKYLELQEKYKEISSDLDTMIDFSEYRRSTISYADFFEGKAMDAISFNTDPEWGGASKGFIGSIFSDVERPEISHIYEDVKNILLPYPQYQSSSTTHNTYNFYVGEYNTAIALYNSGQLKEAREKVLYLLNKLSRYRLNEDFRSLYERAYDLYKKLMYES